MSVTCFFIMFNLLKMQIASYSLTIRIISNSITFSQIFTYYHRPFSVFQVGEFCCRMRLKAVCLFLSCKVRFFFHIHLYNSMNTVEQLNIKTAFGIPHTIIVKTYVIFLGWENFMNYDNYVLCFMSAWTQSPTSPGVETLALLSL